MNYYPRYPAHYVAKTMHLTMEQDGAYTRLLDWCYMNERPIPHASRYAIARAMTASERKAVDAVIGEFFSRTGDDWSNGRTVREIELAQPKIAASKVNGRKGGRPRKDNPAGSPKKPSGFSEQNPEETHVEPTAKAPQSPIFNQEQEHYQASSLVAHEPAQGGTTSAGRACLLMRQAGCPQSSPSHPDLLAALAEGVTPEALADTVREGLARSPPVGSPFAWAIATARGRREEGAKPIHRNSHGASHAAHRPSLAERAAEAHRFADERERELAAQAAEHL